MKQNPRSYARQLVNTCLARPGQLNEIIGNFWRLVLANKHFGWRRRIVQEVDSIWHEVTSQAQVKVWSARELSATERQHLSKVLTKALTRPAEFEWEVKPHLLGGLVVMVDGARFDVSVKGRLDALYYNLAK